MKRKCEAKTRDDKKCQKPVGPPLWHCGTAGHVSRWAAHSDFGGMDAASRDALRKPDSCSASLTDARALLQAQQAESLKITDQVLALSDDLIEHLGDTPLLELDSVMIQMWYDPSEASGELSHKERRMRRHAAMMLFEAAEKNGVDLGGDVEDVVGPPVERPEGFEVQQQKPKRPRTTVAQAQQLWAAADLAAGTAVARWIIETRKALSMTTRVFPWALRCLTPKQLASMSETVPLAQKFPESTDIIAVWSHVDPQGEIRCVSLDALTVADDGTVGTTEPRWRRNVGKHVEAAMYIIPGGHKRLPEDADIVYLVEGPVDAVAVSAYHKAPAVACGGTGRPAEVAALIAEQSPHAQVVCIADGDKAGRKAMQLAAKRNNNISEIIEMPDGVDPGEHYIVG